MLRFFNKFALILFFLLVIPTQQEPTAENISLMLVGVVVDIITKQPISDAKVELVVTKTREEKATMTNEAGSFSFNLAPDNIYELSLVNEAGITITTKEISTINHSIPDVLHAILEYSAQEDETSGVVKSQGEFYILKQKPYASDNKEEK